MQNGNSKDSGVIDGGKSVIDSDPKPDHRNQDRNFEPEIIGGFEDPATERIDSSTGNEPRRTKSGNIDGRTTRRGRPRKFTGGTETKEQIHLGTLSIEDVLFNIHAMLASMTDTPELVLERDEAKQMSDATQELAKFYNVLIDPKKVAIANFTFAVGKVYGTRIFAIRNRLKFEAKQKLNAPGGALPTDNKKRQSAPPPNPATASPSELFGDQGAGL